VTGEVVKFPLGRVVREHRISFPLGGMPESEAIDRAAFSVRRAIETLRRQQATLIARASPSNWALISGSRSAILRRRSA
jgi:hypothetical protein